MLTRNNPECSRLFPDAYFAGMFDGKGTIAAYVKPSNGNTTLYVAVGSTDMKITKLFHQRFGGYLTSPRISSVRSKRLSRDWKATNDVAVEFLKTVYPFLIIKKRQAAVAFKIRRVVTQGLWSKDAHRKQLLLDLSKRVHELDRGHVETVKEAPEMENSQSIVAA